MIALDQIRVQVRIGLNPEEHEAPQTLIVSAELYVAPDYLSQSLSGHDIIDYSVIYEAVKAWEGREHVELIETYMNELIALCFQDPRVEACDIYISKPDIFADAYSAGVQTFMKREDWKG